MEKSFKLFLAGIIFALPLAIITLKGHDSVNHLIISRLFAEQVLAGDIFPKWLMDMNAGLGSPVLYHFPIFPYLASFVFYPFNFLDSLLGLPQGFAALGFSITLALILSGIFMQLFMRGQVSAKAALVSALFYMLVPYHLGVDLYERFALSELWGLAFMPLCLYAARGLALENKCGSLLSLGFALLILSHLMTAFIFVPVLGFYFCVVIAKDKEPWKKLLSFALFMGLGITLSAFYLLPAVSNKNFVTFQLEAGIYSYAKNFITEPIHSLVLLAGIVTFIFGFSFLFARNKTNSGWFWLVILAISAFMAFPVSKLLWENIPLLASLSFPWRFLILSTLASSILLAYFMDNFSSYRWPLTIIAISVILLIPYLAVKNTDSPGEYLRSNTLTIDDYRTRWTNQRFFTEDGKRISSRLLERKAAEFGKERAIAENGTVKLLSWKPREIILAANMEQRGMITIRQFYFPFWKAYKRYSEVELRPSVNLGLIEIILPHGRQEIKLVLQRSREEKIGFWLSGLSILFLVIYSAGCRKNRAY